LEIKQKSFYNTYVSTSLFDHFHRIFILTRMKKRSRILDNSDPLLYYIKLIYFQYTFT